MTRQALGKGLSALLKDRESVAESDQKELDIDLLEPNRYQPRQMFSEAKLDELAQSIRAHGFIQPMMRRWRNSVDLSPLIRVHPCSSVVPNSVDHVYPNPDRQSR